MMNQERRVAIAACVDGRNLRAYVAALVLSVLAGAVVASAAEPVRPSRLHRTAAAQSAGAAEAHGKVQPSKPAGRRGSAASRGHAATPKPGAKASEKADAAPAKSHAKSRRRRNAAPEAVSEPVTMYRAEARRVSGKRDASATQPMRAAAAKDVTAARVSEPVDTKRVLTVDDFVRAAGGTVSQQSTSSSAPAGKSEVMEQGVSHPDDAPIEVSDAKPAAAVKAKPVVAAAKPAPIVRMPAAVAEVSDAGVKYEDAPQAADVLGSKVVQGFGGEVEVLPRSSASNARPAARRAAAAPAPDEIADDGLSQRELTEDAIKPMVVPMYTRAGKLIVPPPLKGTHEILVHQNLMADDEGLTRIKDDEDLDRMRAAHLLVGFPAMAGLEVNDELPMNRRYARPWTVKFAADTARAFYARFHEPLHLNSAVRTVDYQLRLQRVNGNAAAVDGDVASPHLTGQAIDLGKHGMSVAEIAWMRSYLLPLMQAGKVDVEEEFQQACFHISVYGSYWPAKKRVARTEVAQLQEAGSRK